jgi:hypothetical protein
MRYTNNLLKYGGKNTFLADMFNEIFVGENMPHEYNTAYILPTYRKGDKKGCHSYIGRPTIVTNSI